MHALFLSLAVISVHAGEVCTLPDGIALIEPGKLNWILRDPSFTVPPGTRAIVTRTNPESTSGVAEVKVYDGTNRLGWLASSDLVTVKSTIVFSNPRPKPEIVRTPQLAPTTRDPVKPYGVVAKKVRSDPASIFAMQDAATSTETPPFSLGSSPFAYNGGASGFASGGRKSSGYYVGPRQPSGHYAGGMGSSHKGGHYINSFTNNHYQKRK